MTSEPFCESCGRKLIWTISPAGARLPLDARPVTVYTVDGDHAVKVELQQKVYVSHFTTCPNAGSFSRRQARRP